MPLHIERSRTRWSHQYFLNNSDWIWIGHDGGNPGDLSSLLVYRPSKTVGIALMNSTSAPDPSSLAIELASYEIDNEPVEPELWRPGYDVPAELAGVLGR